ncbi:MAG: DUF1499 domain-containing protein [Longimicrobiales bacterium]
MLGTVWQGLTRNEAVTDPTADDARLRGRTYPVSFDRVWRAALRLADGGLKRWSVHSFDDRDGRIEAIAARRFSEGPDRIVIRITLDENAQTRVDAEARASSGGRDYGRNARRIHAFMRALDADLGQSGLPMAEARRAAP